MAKRKHTPQEGMSKLRQAEAAISESSTVAKASRMIGVSKQPSTDGGLGTVGGGSTRRDGSSTWRPRMPGCSGNWSTCRRTTIL